MCVLTVGRFCIPIGNRKCVTRIVKLTKASESSYRKNVAKKFKTLTIKHVVPSVNWIAQTKVGTKWLPLARYEFDDSHRGLCHTLGEMTTMCGKYGALHFLEEHAASSSRANL